MNYNLIFNKTMESLGLDPGQYKMEFAADLSDLIAGRGVPWGVACNKKRTIWVRNDLTEMETVKVILHEVRHLRQHKEGYQHPQDKSFMEADANEYAAANLTDSYLLAKFGKVLSGMELIRAGFELIRTL